MASVVLIEQQIEIPSDLRSLADFRRWAVSDAFPEQGRIDYLSGRIEVDMSPGDLHTHGKLKTEMVGVLWQRVARLAHGEIYTDRARVSCPQADLSVEPDIVFVSDDAIDSGRVRLVPKSGGGADRYVELEGPPDLVVEIISDASYRKDTERLPEAYALAGVPEFWPADARGRQLLFQIHHRGPAGYQPAPTDPEGYQYSAVMKQWYRLDRGRNPRGRLTFTLHAKEAT